MPYKHHGGHRKKSTRGTKRKWHSTKRGHGAGGYAVQQQRLGTSTEAFPGTLFTTLPYADFPVNLFTSSLGVTNQYKSYAMNDPYDPNPSLGGTTAAYFTEAGFAYAGYRVFGSKCRVFATSNSGEDSDMAIAIVPAFVGTFTGNVQVPGAFEDLNNYPMVKWKPIQTYTKSMTVVENKVNLKDWQGIDVRGDPNYWGNAPGALKTINSGSSPSIVFYWVIVVYDMAGAVEANCYINVEIEYYTEFFFLTLPVGYANSPSTALTVDDKGDVVTTEKAAEEAAQEATAMEADEFEEMMDAWETKKMQKALPDYESASGTGSAAPAAKRRRLAGVPPPAVLAPGRGFVAPTTGAPSAAATARPRATRATASVGLRERESAFAAGRPVYPVVQTATSSSAGPAT